jgi:hypothetical protein
MSEEKQQLWVGIGKQVLSGMVGALVAAFLLGGARQRVVAVGKDMDEWKKEWKEVHKPHIDRMDSVGSLSFEHWKQAHDKESEQWKAAHNKEHERQEQHFRDIEKEIKDLQQQHRRTPTP